MNPKIKCYAVEPYNAAVLSEEELVDMGKHIIQGTGYSIVPPKFDYSICDGIIRIKDKDCRKSTIALSQKEGCYVGYSAGANVLAAKRILELANKKINVATVLCDTAFKYSDLWYLFL